MSLFGDFSSAEEVDSDVEKCFDEGTRGRGAGEGVGATVVWVAEEVELEFARKRDWEWLEK